MSPSGMLIAPPLLIRADASPELGTGHVMRMLALGQAWQDETGGAVRVVVAAPLPSALAGRCAREGLAVDEILRHPPAGGAEDVAGLVAAARSHGAGAVVVDHYGFGADALARLRDEGLRVLAFDDYAYREDLVADWIVNPNLHGRRKLYPAMPEDRLLLGPHYAPLRREFRTVQPPAQGVSERARRVLVTLGGSDPHAVTRTVVEGLAKLERDLEVSVVVGGASADAEARAASLRALDPRFTLETNVTDMASRMARHDVAITAGGSTTHELMYLGVPSLLVAAADNQVDSVAAMDAAGIAESLGWYADLSPERVAERLCALLDDAGRRRRMAERCRQQQDGRGGARLVAALRFGVPLWLRPVEAEDRRPLWEWANDPETRASSFATDPIPWEDHVAWFDRKLVEAGCVFLVGVVGDERVGCVRFDAPQLDGLGPLISVTVAPAWCGRGVGRALIAMGTAQILETTHARSVRAQIREDNTASVRAFEAVGYRPCGNETVRGVPARRYEFEPDVR